MSASSTNPIPSRDEGGFTPFEQFLRQWGKPLLTAEEWAASAPDVFETAEGLDEFLSWYRAERQKNFG
ncbi:hypothetical protein [Actinoplanes derwentensis]|uniref:Uncharacterized protein n=1 Tax=Actinoplanes derwentensis TaxID=113562 RepID=A0A1H2D769_9ACTN|nr:hypothetical protein [Actinoplanes derwentensis]GID85573.1 hypothetical protein Ade03nite_44970 [Actinoplanes derwentensis]SDT78312.1 hypothetical protein SAMN04489716_8319 [Actinoplanes derwentensis]